MDAGSAAAPARLDGWQPSTQTVHDTVDAVPLRGLIATLDWPDAAPEPGTPLPPLAHWLYFLPQAPASRLGPDGHARRGAFLPSVALPRRMWAGGRVDWQPGNPLGVGDAARRVSRVQSITHKAGRSGRLAFVVVRHEVHNAQGLAIAEEQDLVYREPERAGAPAPEPLAAPTDAAWRRQIAPDPVLLFRYSALTFNGHRIHYDRDYAVQQEGYPGLVVHGPLIATLLADLACRHAPPNRTLAHFEYRALRPTFDLHPFVVNGAPEDDGASLRLWAHDHAGGLTMRASARLA